MANAFLLDGAIFYDDSDDAYVWNGMAFQGTGGGAAPPQSGVWTITGSQAWADGTSDLLYMVSTTSFAAVASTEYRMTFEIVSYSSGGVYPVLGSAVIGAEAKAPGIYTYDFVASAGQAGNKVHGLQASALNAYVDNFQIYDLTAPQTFQYTYSYQGSDIDAFAVVFHLDYRERRLKNLVLSNTDQSIPIQQRVDRVYQNA